MPIVPIVFGGCVRLDLPRSPSDPKIPRAWNPWILTIKVKSSARRISEFFKHPKLGPPNRRNCIISISGSRAFGFWNFRFARSILKSLDPSVRWVIVSFGVRVSVSLDYLVSLQTGDSLMMLYNFELSHNFDRATKDGCAENNTRENTNNQSWLQ